MRIFKLIPVACLFVASIAGAGNPRCPQVDAPPAPVCVATAHGLAYADELGEAEAAAHALEAAAQRYASHFGRAPVGALVLSTSFDGVAASAFATLHGLEFGQVWLPAKATRAMAERAMRQAGMDRARINRALARAAGQDEMMLRHEVGHAMYAAMFWPGDTTTLEKRYGTPAPDWLDEAVAVAMQSPESQADYLAMFIDVAAQHPRDVPGLADFLASEHPVLSEALARALKRGPKSDSGVQMMVTSGRGPAALNTFYGQSLLTALFLAETSGNPQILSPISTAISDGMDFETWLARDGARHNLPQTISALQPLWDAWIKQNVLKRGRRGGR